MIHIDDLTTMAREMLLEWHKEDDLDEGGRYIPPHSDIIDLARLIFDIADLSAPTRKKETK